MRKIARNYKTSQTAYKYCQKKFRLPPHVVEEQMKKALGQSN